jgi:hypothetical protein
MSKNSISGQQSLSARAPEGNPAGGLLLFFTFSPFTMLIAHVQILKAGMNAKKVDFSAEKLAFRFIAAVWAVPER